ncbi:MULTISPECIES: DUF6318 family protein [unclassified Nocardioides]|uniref:DUF6318 family protein n=1 Tax=unclassified Nocardioides TaxID=2615069 RepID=UPI0006FBF3F9|nr:MULTISPECIES: DUF6318 family protein [unclassified Nocardioides]KQY55468.1 hypothetical protein ASD30_16300 [Nocardioides sp. Root140]KRF12796.1 hypothetical protein ASH02_14820 [Nocardioides sp. Soil796]
MVVRRWVAAALCLPLLALSACSDDEPNAKDEPSPSVTMPSSSTSPSESTTPVPITAPTMPAAAEGSGDKAAQAFARYWVAMVNYAQETGDTEPLKALHSEKCTPCSSGVEAVDEGYANGKSMVGGQYKITSLKAVDTDQPSVRMIGLVVHATRQKKLDRQGRVLSSTPPGYRGFRLYLRKYSGEWAVGWLEVNGG